MTATVSYRPLALIVLVFAGAVATIAGAWGFEWMGYLPCPLCLQQRLPYYAVIPLSLTAALLHGGGYVRTPSALMAACGVIMIFGAGLGVYHAGIEWHFWPGPQSCAAAGGFDMSKDGLPDLSNTRFISCTEAAVRIFGISLAGYNVLIASGLTVLSLLAAGKRAA